MGLNSYLYLKDDSYILFDHQGMSFYTIPTEIGKQVSELGEEERDAILEKVLASKRTDSCLIPEVINKNKCKRLILLLSQKCNLACKYCYGDGGTYGDKCGHLMSLTTAKNAIDKMIEMFPEGINLIQFFGGEPLLNYSVIEGVCEYCNELLECGKIKECPQFAIVTNGTIMNESIRDLFNKFHINVTISLDGPSKVNDIQRVYANSNSSVYEKIIQTIDFLNADRNFILAVEITLTQHFIDLTEVEKNAFLDYLISKKIDSLHAVPVIDPNNTDLKIKDDEQLKKCMDFITDYSLNTLTTNNPIFLFKAGDFLSIVLSKTNKEHFCSAGITNFAIDTQGDIYGCFMLINPEKDLCMGNVNSKEINMKQWNDILKKFEKATFDSCKECKDCYLKGLCSNCVAASYLQYGAFDKPNHQQCAMQFAMFERIGYHLAHNNIKNKTKL